MPKRKTGARKKAEKQKERQAQIRAGKGTLMQLGELPCNSEMECAHCGLRQKNRAFCYFCAMMPRLPQCGACGRTKCAGGDCLNGCRHAPNSATGVTFVGAVCDFCETWICHSRRCITTHACTCPLRDAECIECKRDVNGQGGRIFKCATCSKWLCEDDQFEHQASCTYLDSDDYKCVSCNRAGMWSCLRCKVSFCQDHIKRPGVKINNKEDPPCRKCHFPASETKTLAMSIRSIDYGRQARVGDEEEEGGQASFTFGGVTVGPGGAKIERQPAPDDDVDDYGSGAYDYGKPDPYDLGGFSFGLRRMSHSSSDSSGGDEDEEEEEEEEGVEGAQVDFSKLAMAGHKPGGGT